MLRRFWFLGLCCSVALIAVVVGNLVHLRMRSASSRLPERGMVVEEVGGLPGTAEVILDDRGIPHVRADDERTVWFVVGYLHARDRFFQMDLMRRVAAGRLAELVGPSALSGDRKARIWRIEDSARRQAAELGVGERWALEAYTRGVNAALDRFGRWISPETWLLGLPPDRWHIEDSLCVGLLVQLQMSPAMGEEIERAVELARLGRERSVDLWGWSPEEADRWLPPAPAVVIPPQRDEAIMPSFGVVGSNAWAVSPRLSASGRALLANDPHLGVSIPGSFYAMHLFSPEMHVAGATLPGSPGVLTGHNERVAWGLTNAMVDDQDLFVLTLDENRSKELVDGEWIDLRTVTEQVRVRWRDEPELVKILLSERGPVVRDRGREVLALEWTGLRAPSAVGAVLEMNRARTALDIVDAWRDTSGPYLHVVAADSGGRLVQFLTGAAPDRRRGAGRLPSPGQESGWAWHGTKSLADGLSVVDPENGFVAAANHDPIAEGDFVGAPSLAGEFATPWRVRRIRQQLAGRSDWRIGDFVELQGDLASGLAVALLRQLRPELEEHDGPSAKLLASWDGRLDRGSPAAFVYANLLVELGEAVGGDEAARDGLPATLVGPTALLRLLVGGVDSAWWDDVGTDPSEERAAIVRRVLERLDGLNSRTTWGEVHRVEFRHPFTQVPVLGRWLGRSWSRGPYAVGGDGTTVNANYWKLRRPFSVVGIPSLRMVAEVGNWDATVLVVPAGQSGRPWSAHYADQLEAWLNVAPVAFPFSEEAVDAAASARLSLRPPQR